MTRAFIFPGQGSQQVGMGKTLARHFPVAREVFECADEALGFSISNLCFEGPAEQLMLTENAQPAILTMSIAVLRVLESETSLRAAIVAGHSLGEYSALVAAGSLEFNDAVRLVRSRGAFMQAAVPVGRGAMAAIIGMSTHDVLQVCRDAAAGETLTPSNFNSPQQIVVAGHAAAVDRAVALAEQRGASLAIKLKVSAPFHCSMMQPAAEQLALGLGFVDWRPPTVPVVTNAEAQPNTSADRITELLVRQVTSPVLWTDCVNRMIQEGADEFVEIGLGDTLTRFVRQVNARVLAYSVGTVEQLRDVISRSGKAA